MTPTTTDPDRVKHRAKLEQLLQEARLNPAFKTRADALVYALEATDEPATATTTRRQANDYRAVLDSWRTACSRARSQPSVNNSRDRLTEVNQRIEALGWALANTAPRIGVGR